jgi:4-oxalocrotonate tautomerase
MPHIIIKMFPGRNNEQKKELTERVVRSVEEALGSQRRDISVSIVEVDPGEWDEKVVRPDLAETEGEVTRMPGYESRYLNEDR